MQALIYWYCSYFVGFSPGHILRCFLFFLQRVQVVDSQCCGLWNLTITELDSILCLLYGSNFVRQKFRPFHIILKWNRSLYELISYRQMWIQLYQIYLKIIDPGGFILWTDNVFTRHCKINKLTYILGYLMHNRFQGSRTVNRQREKNC